MGTLVHCWWECKLVQPLLKNVLKFLKKPKIELPYDPSVPLLNVYPKEMKSVPQRDICTYHIHCSIIQSGQDTETI